LFCRINFFHSFFDSERVGAFAIYSFVSRLYHGASKQLSRKMLDGVCMKAVFVFVATFVSFCTVAHAMKTYRCVTEHAGKADKIAILMLDNATMELHFAWKNFTLSPDAVDSVTAPDAHRSIRFAPMADGQDFQNELFNDRADKENPPKTSAVFVSQGLIQEKSSGFVQVEYETDDGDKARTYNCE